MARVRVSKAALWKAIREKCKDCSGGSASERRLCTVTDCSLYPYRNGVRDATEPDIEQTAVPN